jgi:hypothetical protein
MSTPMLTPSCSYSLVHTLSSIPSCSRSRSFLPLVHTALVLHTRVLHTLLFTPMVHRCSSSYGMVKLALFRSRRQVCLSSASLAGRRSLAVVRQPPLTAPSVTASDRPCMCGRLLTALVCSCAVVCAVESWSRAGVCNVPMRLVRVPLRAPWSWFASRSIRSSRRTRASSRTPTCPKRIHTLRPRMRPTCRMALSTAWH